MRITQKHSHYEVCIWVPKRQAFIAHSGLIDYEYAIWLRTKLRALKYITAIARVK